MRVTGTTITWAPKAELFPPIAKTKTRRDRRIPVSSRLKGVLELRRLDPAGQPLPLDRYVFGSEIGGRVRGFHRAWHAAILRAHGHTPAYTSTANLTPASRAALAEIDLHFHDLRREPGSRWMDGGLPLATIQRWLGHTNISQTSVYLAGSSTSEHEALRQYEARQATLQPLATEAGRGGQTGAQTATTADEMLNKTAVGRATPVM
jgi:integrase